jgi:hypothetical protein
MRLRHKAPRGSAGLFLCFGIEISHLSKSAKGGAPGTLNSALTGKFFKSPLFAFQLLNVTEQLLDAFVSNIGA